jgi:hypothetical protein
MCAAAILRDTAGRITDDERPTSLLIQLQQTQRNEARKEKRQHTTQTHTPTPTPTPAYSATRGQFGPLPPPPPFYPYKHNFPPGFPPGFQHFTPEMQLRQQLAALVQSLAQLQ